MTERTGKPWTPQYAKLHERLEQFLTKSAERGEKWTQARVARAVGRSGATISNFLNEEALGDTDDLAKRLTEFLNREDAKAHDRLLTLPYCQTRQSQEVEKAVKFAHRYGRMAMVIGHSGSGKSRTARELVSRDGSLIYVRVSSVHGVGGVLGELCEEIGVSQSGLQLARYKRVRHELKESRCVVVDDAHRLSFKALDLLCSLYDDTGCGLVLMGITTMRKWLSGASDEHEQLASRVAGRVFAVPAFTDADASLLLKAAMPESALDAALDVLKADPKTLGSARRLTYALEMAGRVAGKRGDGAITPELLAAALKRAA